jgi:hypothetical protein
VRSVAFRDIAHPCNRCLRWGTRGTRGSAVESTFGRWTFRGRNKEVSRSRAVASASMGTGAIWMERKHEPPIRSTLFSLVLSFWLGRRGTFVSSSVLVTSSVSVALP